MTVLLVIAALIAVALVVWFINYSNEYSWDQYGCEIFTVGDMIGYVIAFTLLYFGYDWFERAMQYDGDLLNGILLMIIGGIVLVVMVLYSISQTSLRYGIAISLVKMILYAAATPFVIGGVILALAWLMETRPVVHLDD